MESSCIPLRRPSARGAPTPICWSPARTSRWRRRPASSSTPSSSFPPVPTWPATSGEADAGTPVGVHTKGAAGAGNRLALLSMGDYLPIEEHGVIGDLHTVALVGTDGTIDWYCPERFDAPSVFASILDT